MHVTHVLLVMNRFFIEKPKWSEMCAHSFYESDNSILLFTCKLALVASFLNLKFKRIFPLNEATRLKRILKWWLFWNKVYDSRF